MFPKPKSVLVPNTYAYESEPMVKATGFREYDARWLYPQEINLMGLNAIGLGLATLAGRRGVPKRFVVGHDYRSYSASVKQAVVMGLLAGYYRGWVDIALMQVCNVILSFPVLVLYVIIMIKFGPSAFNIIVAVTFIASPQVARLVRSQTLEQITGYQ